MHKENSRWHANLIRKQVRYIEYFLLIGLWRLKMHKSWAIMRFFIGSWSEKKPNRTKKGVIGMGKVTKIAVLPSFWGSKK